jgi:pyruvate/2-oxoglutarate dehydrogenase complex dihydrolipoamide dehydrogenase (E3) component
VDVDYDLIVIGGGAAGLAAAQAGAAAKARTLLISEGELGGECTFSGCVPSKTLIEAAARGAGFDEAVVAVRKTVAAIAATETGDVLTRRGIDVLRGHAEFAAPRQVAVDGRAVRGNGFVLATGSRPAIPAVPGLAGVPYLTNENVFELDGRPESLAIVGGGAMGCELAQAFSRLGSRVTVIEAAPRLLPDADPEVANVLGEVLAAEGVTVRAGTAIEGAEINQDGNGCLLRLPGSATVAAARLLVAAGRVPVTEGLGLDAAGIRVDEGGAIAVGDSLATTADGVYAAGDCTALMPFTHAAYAMGRIAARNALRRRWQPPGSFSMHAIPQVVFTDPEAAQVGFSEGRAAERASGARVAYLPMREVDRAVTAGRTEGFIKIIAGPRRLTGHLGGGQLLGATIVSRRAGEMINELALAIRVGMFTGRLAQATHAYPTYSLGIQQAAAQFFGEYGGRTARPARQASEPGGRSDRQAGDGSRGGEDRGACEAGPG